MRRCATDETYFNPSCIQRFVTPEKFIEEKVQMLREDFYINVTDDDIKYLKQFKTEVQINAAVRAIIDKYWER